MQKENIKKITAIGDIHGRDIWKKIVEKESDSDKIVFVGDYVDTHDNISPGQQVKNFEEILEFKGDNKDQVVLLIGNHDYHYLPKIVSWGIQYSGFQGSIIPQISYTLMEAVKSGIIQVTYVHENNIFVHAGLSKTWCDVYKIDLDNLESSVNNLIHERISAFDFLHSPHSSEYGDPYGNNIWQSPLWIRPLSLLRDCLDDYNQIVGHTQVYNMDLSIPIKCIDTLGTSQEYLVINDGIFKAKTL